ncbi:hypothetical protein AN218_23160 [Streptomyces nanshensis]|uniref:Uncharacterized protein n=1 Tax=Streptomyces nanshensis TaxID=518642 RepID=A0A1E7KZH7_9ACTN|nr:hypothetical protein AN218_23160 [Streptomyces nanshensis]
MIDALTQQVVGSQRFNGLRGECVSMPPADLHAVQDACAAILENVARAVNWARLLQEASGRHQLLHPDRQEDGPRWSPVDDVCGECLEEALLAEGFGSPDWGKAPSSPREFGEIDWPTVVAKQLPHRGAAHWHPFAQKTQPTPRPRSPVGAEASEPAEGRAGPHRPLTPAATDLLRDLTRASDRGETLTIRYASHGQYQVGSRSGRAYARATFDQLHEAGMTTGPSRWPQFYEDPDAFSVTDRGREHVASLEKAEAEKKANRPQRAGLSPAAARLLSDIVAAGDEGVRMIEVRRGLLSAGRDGRRATRATWMQLLDEGLITTESKFSSAAVATATEAGRTRSADRRRRNATP